jgi:hypothetical protein
MLFEQVEEADFCSSLNCGLWYVSLHTIPFAQKSSAKGVRFIYADKSVQIPDSSLLKGGRGRNFEEYA